MGKFNLVAAFDRHGFCLDNVQPSCTYTIVSMAQSAISIGTLVQMVGPYSKLRRIKFAYKEQEYQLVNLGDGYILVQEVHLSLNK
jgi:hypothetical protein